MWSRIKNSLRPVKTFLGVTMLSIAVTVGFHVGKPHVIKKDEQAVEEVDESGIDKNKLSDGFKNLYAFKRARKWSFRETVQIVKKFATEHNLGFDGVLGLFGKLNESAKNRVLEIEANVRRQKAKEGGKKEPGIINK